MIDHNAVPFSLRQIRYFLATAETLSITEAAHRLHISQPSVSTTISALEEMFGTQLFIRHHAQGMSLTPAGRLLASEARALLKQSEELNATLKEFRTPAAPARSRSAFWSPWHRC
ncbi:LysR family transcriptional regulator [Undibacterium arcticum]|uniref:LysR family transcriptional regulator n=1 Tax=Undibacterium arcticum TaxID=1762892 RepID=UPI0036213BB0